MEELNNSELSTKDYWDNIYSNEIKNYECFGDTGEIWFGETVLKYIVKWICDKRKISKNSKIVDIGCGNGLFLLKLAEENYCNLYGIDYSENAIKLAKAIAKKHDLSLIHFTTLDILHGLEDTFDIIHDKGTYDAISLSENSKTNRQIYLNNISKSLNINGYFIITSCNWSEDELNLHFKDHFNCFQVIPTQHFQFGGKIGHKVVSIIYTTKINNLSILQL